MKPKSFFILFALGFLIARVFELHDKTLMLIGFVICAGFYHVLNAIEKKSSTNRNTKPTCITVWGILSLTPLLCGGFVLVSGSYADVIGTEVEEYKKFNAICWWTSMCLDICLFLAAIGVLSIKERARVQMVKLCALYIAFLLLVNGLDFFYFIPKYNINVDGDVVVFQYIGAGGSILLNLWCRSNMNRSDVVAYFRKRNFGSDYTEGDEETDSGHFYERHNDGDPADWWKK